MFEEQTQCIPEKHPDYKLFQDDIRSMSSSEPVWNSPAAIWTWKAWQAGRVHERIKRASLGELYPEGLTDKQKIKVLEQTRRFCLLAFKRIAEGYPDPAKYAELTLKHLDTPSTEYLISMEFSKKDIDDLFDSCLDPSPIDFSKIDEPIYMNVRSSEVHKFVQELLKKAKL